MKIPCPDVLAPVSHTDLPGTQTVKIRHPGYHYDSSRRANVLFTLPATDHVGEICGIHFGTVRDAYAITTANRAEWVS